MKSDVKSPARSFLSAVHFCFSLSWETSKKYTILRLFSNLLPQILGIVTAWLGKCMLDVLTGILCILQPQQTICLLSVVMLSVAILRAGIQKAGTYAQSMHEDILSGKLSVYMMEKALNMDVEYFDDPDCCDKIAACNRDI